MAKVKDTVEFDFVAKLAQFESMMQQIPGMSEEAAKQLVNKIDRQIGRANRLEAKRMREQAAAMKTAADRTRELEERWDAATRIASAFGGAVGDVADVTEYLGRGLGGLVGKAGLAAAGVGAISYAAVQGTRYLWDFVDGTEAAVERLGEIEGVEPLPLYVTESLEGWERASLAAEVAGLQLRTTVAAGLTPAMEDLALTMAGGLELVRDLHGAWRDLRAEGDAQVASWDRAVEGARENLGVLGDILGALYDGAVAVKAYYDGWGALGWVLGEARDVGEQSAAGLRDQAAAARDADGALSDYVRTAEAYLGLQDQILVALTGASDEQVRYAQEVERVNRVVDERLAALEAEGNLTDAAVADAEAMRQAGHALAAQIRDETTARREAAAEAERLAKARERAAAAAAREAEAAAALNEHLRLERARKGEVAAANQGLRDIILDTQRDEMSAAEQARQRHLERLAQVDELAAHVTDSWLIDEARAASEAQWQQDLIRIRREGFAEAQRMTAELAEREAAAAQQRFDDQMAVGSALIGGLSSFADAWGQMQGDMSDTERTRMLAAFRAQQVAMTGQIAMYTAAATQRALADLGPVAGALAAGGIVGAGLAQTAVVWSQQPPELAAGGLIRAEHLWGASRSPDHGAASVAAGEYVVSRRGVDAAGVEELDRINRGEPSTVRAEITMRYRHRPFDRFIEDNLQRPGPLGNAISGTRRPGHSAR